MQKILFAVLLTAVSSVAGVVSNGDYGKLPFRFEKNVGQLDPKIFFMGRGGSYRVFLTHDGATLLLDGKYDDAVVRISPDGAEPPPEPRGEEKKPSASRYYRGKDVFTAPHFSKVRYSDVYEGIDLVFYGDPQRLEYDFVVNPGADPSPIRLRIEGGYALALDESGRLRVETDAGALDMLPPVAYQTVEGERRPVEAAYRLAGVNAVEFALGEYDSSRPLVIDPILVYGTYLGGADAESAAAVAVNAAGEAHVVGMTRSFDFPSTPGALQEDHAGGSCGGFVVAQRCFDLVVAKLNADGSDLVYATYFGGAKDDLAADAALDGAGNLVVAGTTYSLDFPTSATAWQRNTTDTGTISADAFVLKLNPNGARVYSTRLGGSRFDEGVGVAADSTGAAYLAGHTKSFDFPTTAGAVQPTNPSDAERTAAFAARISPDGSTLSYATYLAGSLDDRAAAIAVDRSGSAVIVGSTASPDFPTARASVFGSVLQDDLAGSAADAFITKLAPNGSRAIFSTYLGAEGADAATDVSLDDDGLIYVIGSTESRKLRTTPGAFLPIWKRSQGFAAKLRADGTSLIYLTYLMGTADRLAVDANGSAHVSGVIGSSSTIFGGPVVPACNGSILRKLSPEGNRMMFSGFVQGLGTIDLDAEGFVYSAASGGAGLRTTPGAVQSANSGQTDLYLSKWRVGEDSSTAITCIENGASFYPGKVAPGEIVTLFGSGLAPHEPAWLQIEGGIVQSELNGVRVLFDGVPAPMLYAQWNQINAVAPYALDGKTRVSVQLERDGRLSDPFELPVGEAHPGLFTLAGAGNGPGAILNQDNSLNTEANPAEAGSIITLFGTGEGQTDPPGIDGLIAPFALESLAHPVLPVRVWIGGVEADVRYVGAAPGLVSGVVQINVRVPENTPSGRAFIGVRVGDESNHQQVYVEIE